MAGAVGVALEWVVAQLVVVVRQESVDLEEGGVEPPVVVAVMRSWQVRAVTRWTEYTAMPVLIATQVTGKVVNAAAVHQTSIPI